MQAPWNHPRWEVPCVRSNKFPSSTQHELNLLQHKFTSIERCASNQPLSDLSFHCCLMAHKNSFDGPRRFILRIQRIIRHFNWKQNVMRMRFRRYANNRKRIKEARNSNNIPGLLTKVIFHLRVAREIVLVTTRIGFGIEWKIVLLDPSNDEFTRRDVIFYLRDDFRQVGTRSARLGRARELISVD